MDLKFTSNLALRHPHFIEASPMRISSRDLFEGARVVKRRGDKYLFKLDRENFNRYEFRLKRAVYENWLAVLIEFRQALLWRTPPTRKLPASISGYEADVTGFGESANSFFKRVSESGQVDGLCWVRTDKPVLFDQAGKPREAVSAKEEEELNLRPRFELLGAERVLDWRFGEDGRLDWAVIRTVYWDRAEPGEPGQSVTRYEVITRKMRAVFEASAVSTAVAEASKESVGPATNEPSMAEGPVAFTQVGEDIPNHIGVVPLVPFYGIKDEDGLGWPVTVDWIDPQLAIYNKGSDLDMGEWMSSNPIPVFIGPKHPGDVPVLWGDGLHIQSEPGGAHVAALYLEPTATGLEAVRRSIESLKAGLVERALRQTRRESKAVKSAETIKAEQSTLNASLVSVAEEAQTGETLCWELMAMYAGEAKPVVDITYADAFGEDAVSEELLRALGDMVDRHQLSKETMWKLLQRAGRLPSDFDAKKEMALIEADRDAAAQASPFANFGGQAGGAPFGQQAPDQGEDDDEEAGDDAAEDKEVQANPEKEA